MGKMTLREALDEYKSVYMAYRNFAERTRVEYTNDLQDFIEFLEKSGIRHVEGLGLPIIERYVAHLEQVGYAGLTRKRKVVTVRSFLIFLYQDGYIDSNIGKKVILPFAESTSPNILTQTECERLRQACADNPRDSAIIELLLQTGIKLSELTHLTLDDIELEGIGEKVNGFIRIIGSRGKQGRIISLDNQSAVSLKLYLRVRNKAATCILFLNRFDKPMGERGVQKTLKKYFEKADIPTGSVHTLRHTFATLQVAKKVNLQSLQNVMGLKDNRSTISYKYLAERFF